MYPIGRMTIEVITLRLISCELIELCAHNLNHNRSFYFSTFKVLQISPISQIWNLTLVILGQATKFVQLDYEKKNSSFNYQNICKKNFFSFFYLFNLPVEQRLDQVFRLQSNLKLVCKAAWSVSRDIERIFAL